MRKTVSVIGGLMLMAATGYGAWALYKKMNPKCAEDMEDMMEHLSRDVEKEVKDMM